MRITVRVPATSANLGPGFDCFGLALDLCNEVTIDTDAEPGVSWEGEGADELPTDGTDMVTRATRSALERQRKWHPDAALPAFALHGVNRIPLESGLGSSSAAAVAGVAAAAVMLGTAGWDHLFSTFAYAAAFEGHSDNAAPAVFGGFTIVASGVTRFDVHPSLTPVVLVPTGIRLSTALARAALADPVPRADAVDSIGHAGITAIALTQDPSLLLSSLEDRLHQRARLALVPSVEAVFDDLWRRQVPVCVSGAGPSLLAFEVDGRTVPDPGEGWTVLRPGVRAKGFEVTVES